MESGSGVMVRGEECPYASTNICPPASGRETQTVGHRLLAMLMRLRVRRVTSDLLYSQDYVPQWIGTNEGRFGGHPVIRLQWANHGRKHGKHSL